MGEKNRALTDAARAGNDEAFFDLLGRDPRQLASELTQARVITWRTEIDEYNRFFRFKVSRFLAPSAAAADAQRRMEEARRKLGRLGASQLDLYDQRGKRPLPLAYLARGFYYGLLCLLQGLRAVHSDRENDGMRPRQIEAHLSELVSGLANLAGAAPFLPYVRLAVRLVRDREIMTGAGFADCTLAELVGTRAAAPSDTARVIAAAALEVSDDTIERLAAQPAPLPLPSPPKDPAVDHRAPDLQAPGSPTSSRTRLVPVLSDLRGALAEVATSPLGFANCARTGSTCTSTTSVGRFSMPPWETSPPGHGSWCAAGSPATTTSLTCLQSATT